MATRVYLLSTIDELTEKHTNCMLAGMTFGFNKSRLDTLRALSEKIVAHPRATEVEIDGHTELLTNYYPSKAK